MSDILTSELAISENMPFPPYISKERIDSYTLNLKRYEGKYNENKYIRIKNLNGGIDLFPLTTENYFKLITSKLQGLLLNEKPFIKVKANELLSDLLNKSIASSGFWKAFIKGYRDFSSLGTGCLYLSFANGKPTINATNPKNLYKIVNPQNIDEITCYILTQPIFTTDYTTPSYQKIERMRVLYHYVGYYVEKVYRFNENGQLLNCESEKKVETGLTDFAVFCFDNSTPSGDVWGISDYDNIADVVQLFEQTITLVGAVLVKNINPILQVPIGTFKENEQTGKLEAPSNGQAVEVSKEDGDLKYISYDQQITDIVSYINLLLNELGIQSEMSKTFLTGEFTSNLSGEAIKSLLKAPLDKISRAIDEFDDVIKALFVQVLHLLGYEVEIADIEITWRDGISQTVETEDGEQKEVVEVGGVVVE